MSVNDPIVGAWFWASNSDSAGEVPWTWNSRDSTTIEIRITYDPPAGPVMELISLEYPKPHYMSPKPPKLEPETGWIRIHEKVKTETIQDRLKPVKNLHYRKHHRLNYNHRRRFN